MKIREVFKEIFDLIIRFLGVYFLWAGLSDLNVPVLMNVQLIESDQLTDIVSAILPAVFNLIVAWWLFGGAPTRRAYPWELSILAQANFRLNKTAAEVKINEPPVETGMDLADKKLAALVTDKK